MHRFSLTQNTEQIDIHGNVILCEQEADMKSNYYVITDIGSTTTKAILIDNSSEEPVLLGIHHANTTVEAPHNDVRYGVLEAIVGLETRTDIQLISTNSDALDIQFHPEVSYLTTSSAGGGLQILVIGLTLFDSASSAKRAAYGAGGIILDVFAIDDRRRAAEQMLAMRGLHPDMILISGGTDGGALTGVIRLAEILRIAKPLPKFNTDVKIPAIYAGNAEAQEIIKSMIGNDFDLFTLPNLRPSISAENLKPTQDMIQKLFMENVMERAPGYNELKRSVHAEILPTPMGVLKSLISATKQEQRNFFAFDIGGATTDVFSYINGHYQRTVSANLGMSYSALNVLSEMGIDSLLQVLPPDFSADEVRNYIGNKTLYPTYNPSDLREIRIEHAIAKCCIAKALVQHEEMHYNRYKTGFLNSLKDSNVDGYEAKFEYQVAEEKHYFYPSDIDVVIGAGGVFAHAKNEAQSIMILIDAFNCFGITELWLDKDFITPHLGVLGQTDTLVADNLLHSSCLSKLALHLRPHYPKKHIKAVLKISYSDNDGMKEMNVMPESFIVLPAMMNRQLTIAPAKRCILNSSKEPISIATDLLVIIDTRTNTMHYDAELETKLGLYNAMDYSPVVQEVFVNANRFITSEFTRTITLPYKGEVLKQIGDDTLPSDEVAVNKYNPPRLFLVNPYAHLEDVNKQLVLDTLKVVSGDVINFDDVLRDKVENKKSPHLGQAFKSPVRGKLEMIDYNSGYLIISELQDYSSRPVFVDVAAIMMCKPQLALRYIKRSVGDFVYQGDLLAQRLSSTGKGEPPCFVRAPKTGKVTNIDQTTAEITIQYDVSPIYYKSHVKGKVVDVRDKEAVTIKFEGKKLEAKLGIGKAEHGHFCYLDNRENLGKYSLLDSIVGANFAVDIEFINQMVTYGVKGIICPGLSEQTLVSYLKHELGVINTGNELLPLCLVITDSFGADGFSSIIAHELSEYAGKQCMLEPHTRIRAGVSRPFICFMD